MQLQRFLESAISGNTAGRGSRDRRLCLDGCALLIACMHVLLEEVLNLRLYLAIQRRLLAIHIIAAHACCSASTTTCRGISIIHT